MNFGLIFMVILYSMNFHPDIVHSEFWHNFHPNTTHHEFWPNFHPNIIHYEFPPNLGLRFLPKTY